MVTNGARINALICLNANKPNKIKAATNTKIPKFITKLAPLRLYYLIFLRGFCPKKGMDKRPIPFDGTYVSVCLIIQQDPLIRL